MTTTSSRYKRIANDHYPTPEPVIDVVLNEFHFNKMICDPCCGESRRVLKAAKKKGHAVCGTDIIFGIDFIRDKFKFKNCDIVTNPPYGDRQSRLALAFIKRALEVTAPWSGNVAMLLPVDFDSGRTRAEVFGECDRFALKIILLNRVRWFRNKSGTTNHAWYVWSQPMTRRPIIKYAIIDYEGATE